MQSFDILGIGTAAVDDLVLLEHFPAPDSKTDYLSIQRQGGGQTATAMATAARLGARTAFCTHLCFDDLSDFTLNELEKEGVDCSSCVRSADGSPYHSLILVDITAQTRTILHSGGKVNPPEQVITPELVGSARLLCLDDNSRAAGIQAARIARSLGIPVVADIEPDPPPDYVDLLPLVDHLVINRELGAALTGLADPAAMSEKLSYGITCCAITAGAQGCWYATQGQSACHIPAYQVQVVDTTGCGDVFHGAYAFALSRGQEIGDALRLASAVAAMKARFPGGRAGIPRLEEVQKFMREHD